MPAATTNNVEHLAFDSPIGLPGAVIAALALLVLFAYTLRREQATLGAQNAVLFWILRAVSLGVAIWMLLAPMSVSVQRSTTRHALAVMADGSKSMATVDPDGTADELRWALSASGVEESATKAVDGALAATGIAERHLQNATQSLREHRSESNVQKSAVAARDAIEYARNRLNNVFTQSGQWDENNAMAATHIKKMLSGADFQAFDRLVRALERGRTPSQPGWRESLPDLEHRLAGIRRRLAELAHTITEGERNQWRQEIPQAFTAITQASRLARIGTFVASLENNTLGDLRAKADVRYSMFDESLAQFTNQESPAIDITNRNEKLITAEDMPGPATNLSAALEHIGQLKRQQPVAAVFIVTDVIHNDPNGPHPRDLATDLTGTPVYVVPIGNTRHVRDVKLQSVLAPNIAMRNDDVVVEASLQAYACDGEICVVELMKDGEVIERQDVAFDSEVATRTVRFETRMSEVGVHQYQVSATPLEGELSDDNNFDQFEVNVTRSDIKVLLADDKPRWEYGYLTRLFRRDSKIDCDELLFRPRLIATGRRAESTGFPTTVDEWDQYDVVILGDVPTENLSITSQETLIEYLRERGGTLVMIAGHESMPHAYASNPLEEILPVTAVDQADAAHDDFAFHVTELGRDHNALMIGENAEATRLAWDFVNRNAPLHSLSQYRKALPTTRTLIGAVPRDATNDEAAARDSVFLCWQPVKRGRIVYLSGGETYRLRFLRGDRLHYRLWGQMLRWAIAGNLAAGSEHVRVRTDKSRYRRSDTVQITVRLADAEGAPVLDADIDAIAVRADDQQITIPLTADEEMPGQYRGEINQPEPGVYRVEPVGPAIQSLAAEQEVPSEPASASFTVRADLPPELLDTRTDLALAQQIADATGGQVIPPTAVDEVIALTDLEPEITEIVETKPLWVQWKFLWIIFACLQTEWIIRKWKGLS